MKRMKIALTLDRDASERETNDYVRALRAAGFGADEIVVLPPGASVPPDFDGAVLGGGGDVDPARYGQSARETARLELDPDRDATDFAVFDAARRNGTPTLAICRGLQVANVALGGTLVQDLPTEKPSPVTHERREKDKTRLDHPVSIRSGTLLARIAGSSEIRVNSRHHQAVADPAPGLMVSAVAPDGVVEAVESEEPWLLGVQWHPENLADDPASQRLFAEFARAVRARAVVLKS